MLNNRDPSRLPSSHCASSLFLRVDIHLPDSIPWPIARRPLVFSTEADAREACDFTLLKACLEYLLALASLSFVISGLSNRC